MKSTINEIESAINKSTKLGIEINLAPLQGNFTEENIFTFGDKKAKTIKMREFAPTKT